MGGLAGTRVYFRQVGGLSQTLATAHRVQSIVDYLHTVCVPPRDKHQHEHKHELCLTPVTHIACENQAAIGDGAPVESHPWRIYLGKELYLGTEAQRRASRLAGAR